MTQLERIQNKMLYQQYVAKKKLLDSQNPKGTKNERKLWHGTAPDAVNSINSLGFNRSHCGKNGKNPTQSDQIIECHEYTSIPILNEPIPLHTKYEIKEHEEQF